jgi:hypothetical protein
MTHKPFDNVSLTKGNNTMHQTLIIEAKSNYGNQVFYPVNECAKLFAEIAGTKTLGLDTIKKAKLLGFVVEVKQPSYTI